MRYVLAALALAVAAPAAAQEAGDDLVDKIINLPPPAAHVVNGLAAKPKVRKDESVQGGKSLRIPVPGKGADPWSVSLSNPIEKPVKAGDMLVLAFWARLEKGPEGAASATIPYAGVQLNKEPYMAVMTEPVTVGSEWKLHEIRGKAERDYAAGELNVSLHLATAKQTIDVGPVFVLNMGQ